MTIVWSGGGTFSNGTGATTTVATIPSGSYGVYPVLVVVAAGRGAAGGSPFTDHTLEVQYTASSVVENLFGGVSGSGGLVGANGANGVDFALALCVSVGSGELDGGATIRVRTNTATASPPEVGIAVAAVSTFPNSKYRDILSNSFGTGGSMASGTITGTFSTASYTTPLIYDPESTAIGILAFAGTGSGAVPTWASLGTWADIITQTNGSNRVQIAEWTRPGTLNTDIAITNSPGAGNGTYEVFSLSSTPGTPTANGRNFAAIVG